MSSQASDAAEVPDAYREVPDGSASHHADRMRAFLEAGDLANYSDAVRAGGRFVRADPTAWSSVTVALAYVRSINPPLLALLVHEWCGDWRSLACDDPAVLAAVAVAFRRTGDAERAAEVESHLLALSETDAPPAAVRVLRALAAMDRGDIPRAAELAASLEATEPRPLVAVALAYLRAWSDALPTVMGSRFATKRALENIERADALADKLSFANDRWIEEVRRRVHARVARDGGDPFVHASGLVGRNREAVWTAVAAITFAVVLLYRIWGAQ